MNAAKERTTAEIVALGEARAQRGAAAPRLDTAGAMLAAARADAGYAILDVAEEINVRSERLEAIEAMDIDALPAAPYTLGFVRAYAGFLGLPVEPLVARFREEAGWTRPVTAPRITAPKGPVRDREVGLFGVLVVLLFIVWALWQIVGRTPPEDDTALPTGFPIADRTQDVQVVPEVTTSLEDDLTLTPPVMVEGGDAAPAARIAPAEAVAPAADQAAASRTAADRTATDQAAMDQAATDQAATDQATTDQDAYVLVPRVLSSPLDASLDTPDAPDARDPAPDARDPAPAAPARLAAPDTPQAAPAPAPAPAQDLDERLPPEVMAENEPALPEPTPVPSPVPSSVPSSPRTAPPATVAPTPTPTESPLAESAPAVPTAPAGESVAAGDAASTGDAIAAPTASRAVRTAAELTDPVAPVYPRRCRRSAAEEEVVVVAFNVSRLGRVTGPSVASSTNDCFDRAALAAVSRFGFAPATEGGRAVGEAGRTSRIVFRAP